MMPCPGAGSPNVVRRGAFARWNWSSILPYAVLAVLSPQTANALFLAPTYLLLLGLSYS